ncbi:MULTISPECIES: CGNR zinc finger domain-containing protein [unclassified Brenneria]|uniref:CGNR zinc finger domain-containing protein n=1 Tax=unclassified Brenneria TaxID=2634434 RepID=UPI0029C20892|nr:MULTISPECIES: CGNR zinc finger domain-containing protein [unclassified Brenneria]MDX5628418.1 CGNR zinc finger domain-containing protein [Brenneria sp. L3-3Z]MDX5695399.1 CGNR zinc finger domain-containing protein [Brenneria sp. L4-2C]
MSMSNQQDLHFIANNLALDFVNSAYGTGDERRDYLTDDASVVAWLKAAGELPEDFDGCPAGLAQLGRALREEAETLIATAKTGRPGKALIVNQILEAGRPVRRLLWDAGKAGFILKNDRYDLSAASLLEPVAASLARLLAADERQYVRQCEAHDCTLYFLDVTKSRRRRWCSMAICGNRMKVAAFRSRKHAD